MRKVLSILMGRPLGITFGASLILVALVPLVVVLLFARLQGARVADEFVESKLGIAARAAARELDHSLRGSLEQVRGLSRIVVLGDELDLQALMAGLDQFLQFHPFVGVQVIDLQGRLIAAAGEGYLTAPGLEDWLTQALSGPETMSPPHRDALGRPVVAFAAPVADGEGSVAGAVVAYMELGRLSQVIESLSFEKTGHVRLVDAEGLYLVGGPYGPPLSSSSWPPESGNGTSRLAYVEENGRGLVAVDATFEGPSPWAKAGWRVMALQAEDEAFALQRALRRTVAVASLVGLGVAIVMAVLLSRWILAPLRCVIEATRRLARGDFGARVAAGPRGELGILIEAFNEMADELEQATQLRTVQARLRRLQRACAFISSLRDPQEVARRAAQATQEVLAADIVVLECAVDGCHAVAGPRRDIVPELREKVAGFLTREASDQVTGEPPAPVFLDAGRGAEAVSGPLAALTRRLRESCREAALALLPLHAGRRLLGIMVVVRSHPGEFGEEDVYEAGVLAYHATITLESAHLFHLERERAQRLEELEEARIQFIRTVSHELRTPISSIRASADILADTPPERMSPELFSRLRDILVRGVDRLERLSVDLMDLLSLRSGAMGLNREWTALRPVVESAVAVVLPLAAQNGQRVKVDLEPEDVVLYIDQRRIEEVLLNLLSNAVKYSPPDSTIQVRGRLQDDVFRLEVIDHGPGVPEEERPHLFEPFFRGSGEMVQEVEGRGLGLSIAKGFVELHGGHIGYEPVEGGGSCFYFTLPVRPHDAPEPGARPAEEDRGTGTSM